MSLGQGTGKPSRCLSTALGMLYMVIMAAMWAEGLQECSHEIIDLVETLLKDASSMNSIEGGLYTPNETDYKKCPHSTLTCFMEETKVLEYLNPDLCKRQLTRRLKLIPKEKDREGERCLQCEAHRAESLETFLRMLYKILQRWCNKMDLGRRSGT